MAVEAWERVVVPKPQYFQAFDVECTVESEQGTTAYLILSIGSIEP